MRLRRLLRNRVIGLSRRTLAPLATWRAARAPASVPLASVRRRLELVLAAMYARPMRIDATGARSAAGDDAPPDIELTGSLDAPLGVAEAMVRYQLLAIEQAERLVRGTAGVTAPPDALVRDLFLLAEGASIDRAIAARAPGLSTTLGVLRSEELAVRQPMPKLDEPAHDVEALLRRILGAELSDDAGLPPRTQSAADSLAWALGEAARLRAARGPVMERYQGVLPVRLWRGGGIGVALSPLHRPPPVGGRQTESPSPHGAGDPTRADRGGRMEGEPTASGTGTPTDAPTPSSSASTADGRGTPARATPEAAGVPDRPAPGGIRYPEWDEYTGRYRPDEVTVRAGIAGETDDDWAVETLRAHAPLVRQVRARFAPLRAHRARLRAQRSGDELDLDACVAALVEIRRGHVPDDRLYQQVKPARRSLAIMLLVDVSGSTTAALADGRTVLDVERMTLLLAGEALDELGDPYAVLAFSSSGRHDVAVDAIKTFAEHDPALVRRRISALSSARNTRLGAAVRHATALLNAQPAERRLLLLLSDGQPNDVGGYQGSYAVGDSRRAVLEARASGVHAFCLTVDREEQDYLPLLFGANGYRILREPSQLPAALLQVVTHSLPV